MTASTNEQGRSRAMGSVGAGALAVAALAVSLGIGLTGLASVGSDRWIEASYGGGVPSTVGHLPQGATASTAAVAPAPALVVGDEQQWLSEPRIATEKTVATSAGGFALGDRVVFSITAKGEARSPARTFEIVGIELLSASPGSVSAPSPLTSQVLIAREVDAPGKPLTLRLLVSDGEAAPANKSL